VKLRQLYDDSCAGSWKDGEASFGKLDAILLDTASSCQDWPCCCGGDIRRGIAVWMNNEDVPRRVAGECGAQPQLPQA
jgi:hypothetical protein